MKQKFNPNSVATPTYKRGTVDKYLAANTEEPVCPFPKKLVGWFLFGFRQDIAFLVRLCYSNIVLTLATRVSTDL